MAKPSLRYYFSTYLARVLSEVSRAENVTPDSGQATDWMGSDNTGLFMRVTPSQKPSLPTHPPVTQKKQTAVTWVLILNEVDGGWWPANQCRSQATGCRRLCARQRTKNIQREFDKSTCSDKVRQVSEQMATHGHHCILKTCRVKLKKTKKWLP